MIARGHPGEVQTDLVQRTVWGTLSTIPFPYVMVVLWKQLSASLDRQPEAVKPLVRGARLLTLAKTENDARSGVNPFEPAFGAATTAA